MIYYDVWNDIYRVDHITFQHEPFQPIYIRKEVVSIFEHNIYECSLYKDGQRDEIAGEIIKIL